MCTLVVKVGGKAAEEKPDGNRIFPHTTYF